MAWISSTKQPAILSFVSLRSCLRPWHTHTLHYWFSSHSKDGANRLCPYLPHVVSLRSLIVLHYLAISMHPEGVMARRTTIRFDHQVLHSNKDLLLSGSLILFLHTHVFGFAALMVHAAMGSLGSLILDSFVSLLTSDSQYFWLCIDDTVL